MTGRLMPDRIDGDVIDAYKIRRDMAMEAEMRETAADSAAKEKSTAATVGYQNYCQPHHTTDGAGEGR